jgi:hypothetical protein
MSESMLGRAGRLLEDRLVRRATAAVDAINTLTAEWHKKSNAVPWSYGVWPLMVQKECAKELSARADLALESVRQAYLALPGGIDLEKQRAEIKTWAVAALSSHTDDLEALLREHVTRTGIKGLAIDLTDHINRERHTLELAIDQFVDTTLNRGLSAAGSIVIHGDGIAIAGSIVSGSTIQQGVSGAELKAIVDAMAALRDELAHGAIPTEARSRIEAELDACDQELKQPQPKVARLFTLLTRAGEIYRTVGATPAVMDVLAHAQRALEALML